MVAEHTPIRISAVLITKDAETHLRECLQSISWCDEIVVVDGGSSDSTCAICAEFGARIIHECQWPGFGPQKNRAIAEAGGRWILSIDADEVVSPALRDEIAKRLALPGEFAAFSIPRRSNFCGQWMHHGGWWPDRVTRLFRNGTARFSDDQVHERLMVDGPVAALNEPFLHYTYDSYEQALDKLNRYSSLGAKMAFSRGRRSTPGKALAHGFWAFIRTYVLRGGFLDGRSGLALALYVGHGTYYRYLKLWKLARDQSRSDP